MTVLRAGTRGDGLRLRTSGGVEVASLAAAGTVPGVVPLQAGGRNGPGRGFLRYLDGTLAWRAPGSSTWGEAITVAADGAYVLEDGEDSHAFLRVQVYTAWLPGSAREGEVVLQDRYNALGPDDVTAAEAAAGLVETLQLQLYNATGHRVDDVLVWLDASVAGLELSDDGVAWVAPTSEGAALALGSCASGATLDLHIRRTITAGAASDPDILNLIHRSWMGE